MVPFGLNEKQFVDRYKRCLDREASSFIGSLRKLFVVPVPDAVDEAEVQIFLGDDGMEAPSAWIYYQGTTNKVDSSDPAIFPGRSMELSSFVGSLDDFNEEYYLNEDFGGVGLIANTTKLWLAECWWKAGGWAYSVPTKVWVHDDFGDGNSIQLSENC